MGAPPRPNASASAAQPSAPTCLPMRITSSFRAWPGVSASAMWKADSSSISVSQSWRALPRSRRESRNESEPPCVHRPSHSSMPVAVGGSQVSYPSPWRRRVRAHAVRQWMVMWRADAALPRVLRRYEAVACWRVWRGG